MKTFRLYKAQRIFDEMDVDPVLVVFETELPDSSFLDQQAIALEQILWDVLPGGVYDLLLGKMLARGATRHVSHGQRERVM